MVDSKEILYSIETLIDVAKNLYTRLDYYADGTIVETKIVKGLVLFSALKDLSLVKGRGA